MTAHFRLATVADAATLSRFGADTFIDWYLPDNDPENVQLHVQQTYSEEHQTAEITDPGQYIMLGTIDGVLAGYTLLRTATPCPNHSTPDMAEIRRFYVGRPWHGTGLAMALMDAVVRYGHTIGAHGFWLTCWERNPRALAFYAKCGFHQVGLTTFTVGTDVQTDHLLALGL